MEKVKQLREEYNRDVQEIEWDDSLTTDGRGEARKELAARYLAEFRRLDAENKEEMNRLEYEKGVWEKKVPPAPKMTQQELLAEQRAVTLLISRLTASGKQNFLQVAEGAATKQPGVYLLAYPKVLEVAEKHYPGPATLGHNYFQGNDEETANLIDMKRPLVFARLETFYDRAIDATTTPEEKTRREVIESCDKKLTAAFMKGFHLDQTIERLKQEAAFSFEDHVKAGMGELF